jgi:hypothetical protein
MISVLLAAALSATDVTAIVERHAMGTFNSNLTYEDQAETRGERREVRCRLARYASDGVFALKKVKLTGQVLVHDPAMRERLGGDYVYKLQPGDERTVDYAILDAEQKAEKYKLLCQS